METKKELQMTDNNNNNNERNLVDHTYRDFSMYLEQGGRIIEHKKSGKNFPAKLHKILSEPNFPHIIAWMPHGRVWKILDKDLLMSEAVPRYFGQTKFESFTRQLSGWGFKRIHASGPDYGGYYHECFLRALPKLTGLMVRVPTNLGKPIPNPEEEPDFYAISRMYPVPMPPPSTSNKTGQRVSSAPVAGATRMSAMQKPLMPTGQTAHSAPFSPSYQPCMMLPTPTQPPQVQANEIMARWHVTQYPQQVDKGSTSYAPSCATLDNASTNPSTTTGSLNTSFSDSVEAPTQMDYVSYQLAMALNSQVVNTANASPNQVTSSSVAHFYSPSNPPDQTMLTQSQSGSSRNPYHSQPPTQGSSASALSSTTTPLNTSMPLSQDVMPLAQNPFIHRNCTAPMDASILYQANQIFSSGIASLPQSLPQSNGQSISTGPSNVLSQGQQQGINELIGLMAQDTNPDGGIADVVEVEGNSRDDDQSFNDDMNRFIDDDFEF